MPLDTDITSVAHAIQQAVAPVFLLSAIAGMLAVMTNRLARVVDRLNELERDSHESVEDFIDEWKLLARRARLIRWAIALCTGTALLICTVIAVLFIASVLRYDTSGLVALAFAAAMVIFAAGLTMFLREVSGSIASMSTEPRLKRRKNPGIPPPAVPD